MRDKALGGGQGSWLGGGGWGNAVLSLWVKGRKVWILDLNRQMDRSKRGHPGQACRLPTGPWPHPRAWAECAGVWVGTLRVVDRMFQPKGRGARMDVIHGRYAQVRKLC